MLVCPEPEDVAVGDWRPMIPQTASQFRKTKNKEKKNLIICPKIDNRSMFLNICINILCKFYIFCLLPANRDFSVSYLFHRRLCVSTPHRGDTKRQPTVSKSTLKRSCVPANECHLAQQQHLDHDVL